MLTDTAVRKAVRRAKAYKLADGRGLYVHVMPTGRKYWRYRYKWQGKERVLTFGEYPAKQTQSRNVERTPMTPSGLLSSTIPIAEFRMGSVSC